MKNLDPIEQIICDNIEAHKEELISIGRDIFRHAEIGFKEFRTAGILADRCRKLGMTDIDEHIANSGVKAYLKGKGAPGPSVCLMAELDGVEYADHPYTWSETGAAHVCGHNAQTAAIIGAAMGLCDPDVMKELKGNVIFMGVPCEEGISAGTLKELKTEKHIIEFTSGKGEFLRIGAFDDCDIVLGHHLLPNNKVVRHNGTNNGIVQIVVTFCGKAAHGASPFLGVDAFAAASLAMHALDIQRETFRERDGVRIHGYMKENGKAANVIADRVEMAYNVRAASKEALVDAIRKFERAMKAGAVATGCGVTLDIEAKALDNLAYTDEQCRCIDETLDQIDEYPTDRLPQSNRRYGSNDFGDVQHVKPAMRFTTGGMSGDPHTKEMHITDEYLAYVMPAKVMALSAYKLLKDDAANAKRVIDSWHPQMTKEEYVKFMREFNTQIDIPMDPLPLPEYIF